MNVGFVGTGNMGFPMAANILKAGHELTLFDARPEATAELERQGARLASDLPAGARAGDVVFDLSTVSPGSTRRLAARAAERGVTLIDAPVSGSVSGARAGTLAVMIGAPRDVVAPYEPVLRAIGTSLFCLGEVGRGNVLKLLNNYGEASEQGLGTLDSSGLLKLLEPHRS
ncbi:MAG: NAD(P)-dependent oxidoreductase [Candidatus Rokubacteria bacterium]|nr:NAD(P)-dependent oxidoreductase [Candidatus Rokubacteria bacterium]